MFEASFFRTIRREGTPAAGKSVEGVRRIYVTHWEDHCVECAYPLCYDSCRMYERRYDGRCIRVDDGLVRNYNYTGLTSFGIDCRMRRWSKLETFYHHATLTPDDYIHAVKADAACENAIGHLARWSGYFHSVLGLRNRYRRMRADRTASLPAAESSPDAFIIQCHLLERESVELLVQADNTEGLIYYSRIFTLKKGENNICIPLQGIGGFGPGQKTRLFAAPLGDEPAHLVFTWLNLVSLENKKEDIPATPAGKIKCVAWDLDNTMWKGVLTEDGEDGIRLREEAVEAVRLLDARGILNTIVSKNSHEDAMAVLKNMGIDGYFLHPAINWGVKSQNLKQIAARLNIGIDSFALVDDNIREREEVSCALPCVRTYAEDALDTLLNSPETDVPVTEESRRRRLSYMQEDMRQELKESISEDYDTFLRALDMHLERKSVDESCLERSLELLARSNQLNLRTIRYSEEELRALMADPSTMCFAFSCRDRFGDYGQVGVMTLRICGGHAEIKDLVISCRIAGKKVEQAMIASLRPVLDGCGVTGLSAHLIRTKRNRPIENVFDSMPFSKTEEEGGNASYDLGDITLLEDEGIVKVHTI